MTQSRHAPHETAAPAAPAEQDAAQLPEGERPLAEGEVDPAAPVSPPPPGTAIHEETDAERAERARIQEAATLAEAESKTAHLPQPGMPVTGALTPAQAAGDGPTVKMNFPTAVTLTRDDYTQVHFPAGIQEVPDELAGHPYLKARGVRQV
jgi:hypothetical protein